MNTYTIEEERKREGYVRKRGKKKALELETTTGEAKEGVIKEGKRRKRMKEEFIERRKRGSTKGRNKKKSEGIGKRAEGCNERERLKKEI